MIETCGRLALASSQTSFNKMRCPKCWLRQDLYILKAVTCAIEAKKTFGGRKFAFSDICRAKFRRKNTLGGRWTSMTPAQLLFETKHKKEAWSGPDLTIWILATDVIQSIVSPTWCNPCAFINRSLFCVWKGALAYLAVMRHFNMWLIFLKRSKLQAQKVTYTFLIMIQVALDRSKWASKWSEQQVSIQMTRAANEPHVA